MHHNHDQYEINNQRCHSAVPKKSENLGKMVKTGWKSMNVPKSGHEKNWFQIKIWKLASLNNFAPTGKKITEGMSGGGGRYLKICDGYVRPHWPPFSNHLSLNDRLLIFHSLLSPNDPIFKMLSHLMTPFFRNIYRWKWVSCSHWITPIFTNK